MNGSIILLAIMLIMAGCAIYLYLKGTFIKAFAMAIAAICAAAAALGFFGILANTLVNLSGNMDLLVQWGEPLCFVLLFVVVFAILQTIINQLTGKPIDLGPFPERIGRAACGFLLGFTLSRVLCSILIMTFLPGLQTNSLGKYLSFKGIVPVKKIEQKKPDKPLQQRKGRPQKESSDSEKKEKLSDTSKSVLGPGFDE